MALSPDFRYEDYFMPRLGRLHEAVKRELAAANGPALALSTIWTGAAMPPLGTMSGEECGALWVRPGQVVPTSAFPEPLEVATQCSSGLMMNVTVGVARCMPRPANYHDVTADPQAIFESLALTMSDMDAVRRAALCGYAAELDDGTLYQASIASWTPIEETAGAVGGIWEIWIA